MKDFNNNKVLLASLFFIVVLLAVYYFIIKETNKKNYDTLLAVPKELSYVDKYTRTNFGFGLDVSDEENKKFNIECLDSDSPRSIDVKRDSSYIACSNLGAAYRIFIGWKNYSYDRLSYAQDVATTILKTRGNDEAGEFTCVEDKAFPWTEKIPATISDCYIKTGDKTLYYSILFLYPAKIREISPTIVIANTSIEDPRVKDKLRDFMKRVKYLPNNPVSFLEEFFNLETKVAYAGGGGGGGGGGAGSCGAGSGSAGCGGGSAGAAGGSGGDGGGGFVGGDAGFVVSCDLAYGQACSSSNTCGVSSGTIGCDGVCNASAPFVPSNYGRVCLASNVCGQSNEGTIGCDGNCSVTTAPALPSGYGTPCQSGANSCGQKANGILGCSGSCTAVTPSDLNCTTCPSPNGNGVCDPKENNSNCPADCPYIAPATTSTPAGEGAIWTGASEWTLAASPNPIFSNTKTMVSYEVSGATGCTLVGVGEFNGKESDRYVGGPAADYPTSKLQENTIFTLTCSNAYSGRKDSKSVRVIVRTINIREF